jgi:SAM-dependent methyltransferase
MIERIVAGSPGREFLDVGCGTGIAARQFVAAGCKVLGVDVDARMADVARATGLDVEVAAFEDWDPAGRAFDAIVSGQTWHWIDPVAGAAKAAQALAPDGRLAVFWNVGRPSPEMAEAFGEVYRRVMPDLPYLYGGGRSALGAYSSGFARAADGIRQADAFAEPERWRFDWERPYTRDEWLDQVTTHGDHSQFPAGRVRNELRSREPLVDMRMMAVRAVWTTNLAAFLLGAGMYASIAVIPAVVELPRSSGVGFGGTAIAAGLLMLPTAAVQLAVGPYTGRIERRLGSRAQLQAGMACLLVAYVALFGAHATTVELLAPTIVLGLGLGLGLSSLANLIVGAVRQDQTGVATGVNTVMRTLGGAFGAQLATTCITSSVRHGLPTDSGFTLAFGVCAGTASGIVTRCVQNAPGPRS